jgi:ATP-dependent Lhr-like helicase
MRELTSGLPDNASFFLTGRFTVLGKPQDQQAVAQARAESLLKRHGVISRHVLEIEGNGWDWAPTVNALSLMELRGTVRRGYFVLGLPGVQFALPETVERLRRLEHGGADDYTVVSAGDIAYVMNQQMVDAADGDAPLLTGVNRIPSTHIVFHGDAPVLRSDAAGERITPARDTGLTVVAAAIRSLRDHLVPTQGSSGNRMTVRTWAGEDVIGSEGERVLEDAGFRRDYPAMTFDVVQSRVLATR